MPKGHVITMKLQRSKPQKRLSIKDRTSSMVFCLASFFNFVLPCCNILSICSIPDYTDSAKAVFDYLGKKGTEDRPVVVWHVKNPSLVRSIYKRNTYSDFRVRFVKKNRLLSFLMFCLSRYIVDTHGLYSMVKMKNRQRSIYLTHGMPVKKFGFEYENDIQMGVQHADYALATSHFYQDVISRSMHIQESSVFPIGLPRNDIFFELDPYETRIRELLSPKYYIYLPTYRVSNSKNKNNGKDLNQGELILGGTWDEWKRLNKTLWEKQAKIVIKPHPLEAHFNADLLKKLNQIIIIDDEWIIENELSLNLIMKYSDMLITDYSGAFIDYLLVDKPIVFFVPDYSEYKDSRGYVFEDYISFLPGKTITQFVEIGDTLNSDEYAQQRSKVRKMVNSQTDANASEIVCNILFNDSYLRR